MKKSFILHNDSLDILDEISIEQAGKLFIAIRNFNICKEQELDNETKLLFLHFKNQFIREDRKSTRLNSSHMSESRMPSSA